MKLIKALFILLAFNAYAQDNFIPGTLTTITGDKITGELNYQDWKKTPKTIQFKVGGAVKDYTPEMVRSFQVESDKFISRKVTLDVTEQRLQRMDKSLETKFEDRHVFLNVLAEGKVNLYEFFGKRTHYFAEKGEEFQELIIRKYFSKNNSDLLTNKKYLGQLRVFLNECNTININENLGYKRKELSKLVNEYNQCVNTDGEEATYIKKVSRQKSGFYATAGYASSNVTINGLTPILKEFEGGNFSSPTIGIGYELLFSKNRAKWSLYNELTYTKINYEERNDKTDSTILYDNFNINYSAINLNFLFRYKFLKDAQKVTPYINLGVGRSLASSTSNTVYEIDTFDDSRSRERNFRLRSGYFTFSAGVGATYNKFSLELRYNRSEKLAVTIVEQINISHLGLMLSYKIN